MNREPEHRESENRESERGAVRRIGPLVLAAMASQALLVILTPTIVDVGRDLGASVGVVGQARAVTAGAAIVTSIAMATLLDRLGIRPLLASGAALAVVASGAIATAPSLAVFIAAHALAGVTFACLLSAGFAGVAAFPKHRRSWAMGQLTAANALAWIIVNPVAGALTDAFSWRTAQAVPAVLGVAALVASRGASGARATAVPGLSLGWAAVFADRSARRWVVAELAAYFAWAANLTFIGAFLIERHGTTESVTGFILALGAAVFFVSSIRSSVLVERFPRRALIAVAAVGTGMAIAATFTVVPVLWATVAFFCFAAAFAGVRSPASGALGLAQLPARPGAMMSARTATVQFGYLLGALAGGVVLPRGGYGALGLLLAVASLVSAALIMRVARSSAETDDTDERRPATR